MVTATNQHATFGRLFLFPPFFRSRYMYDATKVASLTRRESPFFPCCFWTSIPFSASFSGRVVLKKKSTRTSSCGGIDQVRYAVFESERICTLWMETCFYYRRQICLYCEELKHVQFCTASTVHELVRLSITHSNMQLSLSMDPTTKLEDFVVFVNKKETRHAKRVVVTVPHYCSLSLCSACYLCSRVGLVAANESSGFCIVP